LSDLNAGQSQVTSFIRREDLAPVFDHLNAYEATTHFNGQSTDVLNGNGVTGESYCFAHHVSVADGSGA
jgi:hypothetical protein